MGFQEYAKRLLWIVSTALDERAKESGVDSARCTAALETLVTLHKVLQGAATCGERRSKMVPLTSNNNRVSASSQPRSSSALLFDFPPAATLREMTIASVYVTYQFRGGIRE